MKRRCALKIIAVVLPLLCLSLFLYASFSDPQGSKWVFIWQAHYYPAKGNLLGSDKTWGIPEHHTGIWNVWTKDITCVASVYVEDGLIQDGQIHRDYLDGICIERFSPNALMQLEEFRSAPEGKRALLIMPFIHHQTSD